MIFSKVLNRLDQIKDRSLLKIDLALFAFVLLAHGGYLLVYYFGNVSGPQPSIFVPLVTVPVALACIAVGATALLNKIETITALKIHSLFLVIVAVYAIYFGLDAAIAGLPQGSRFSWNPILFAIVVSYPVLLLLRINPAFLTDNPRARLLPLVMATASVPISAAIMWRIWSYAT